MFVLERFPTAYMWGTKYKIKGRENSSEKEKKSPTTVRKLKQYMQVAQLCFQIELKIPSLVCMAEMIPRLI